MWPIPDCLLDAHFIQFNYNHSWSRRFINFYFIYIFFPSGRRILLILLFLAHNIAVVVFVELCNLFVFVCCVRVFCFVFVALFSCDDDDDCFFLLISENMMACHSHRPFPPDAEAWQCVQQSAAVAHHSTAPERKIRTDLALCNKDDPKTIVCDADDDIEFMRMVSFDWLRNFLYLFIIVCCCSVLLGCLLSRAFNRYGWIIKNTIWLSLYTPELLRTLFVI